MHPSDLIDSKQLFSGLHYGVKTISRINPTLLVVLSFDTLVSGSYFLNMHTYGHSA